MVSADSADEGRSARNGEVCGQRNNRRGYHEQPPLATNRCKHRRTVHRSSATHFSVGCREPAPAVRPTGKRLAETAPPSRCHPRALLLCAGGRAAEHLSPPMAPCHLPPSVVAGSRVGLTPMAALFGEADLGRRPAPSWQPMREVSSVSVSSSVSRAGRSWTLTESEDRSGRKVVCEGGIPGGLATSKPRTQRPVPLRLGEEVQAVLPGEGRGRRARGSRQGGCAAETAAPAAEPAKTTTPVASRHTTRQPWKGQTNTRGLQKLSTPRKVGGGS